ncbi:MAG TPA: DUF3147 family protein [Candidatus Dormibacteraeota bacterium]|jgi:hypothetical protein
MSSERRQLIEDDEQPVAVDLGKLREARAADYAIRFAFGAAISIVAGLASLAFGPRVGGLFLAFPAILPATLTLLEKKEGKTKACADASGGVIGAFGLAAFAVVAALLLRTASPALALLAALLVWILVAVGLYFAFRATDLYEKEDRLLRKFE